jgi:RNA polymerase sigma factor (sigma-70 family)
MNEPSSAGPAAVPSVGQPHPLLADRPRLDRILSNMDLTIQRTLYGHMLGDGQERLLRGGVSARDVLQEALLDLLRYDPARLTTSWEGLSVTIARRRAIDAVRESSKGRRATDAAAGDPDEITVVAFDALLDEHTGATVSGWDDPEQAFACNEQQKVLRRLIRELPEPSRTIVNALHYQGRTRVEVGRQVNLTPQRVGQIYAKTLPALLEKAQSDPDFPTDMAREEMTSL